MRLILIVLLFSKIMATVVCTHNNIVVDYIKSLKFEDETKIFIKKETRVNKIIQELINGGYENLQIISDYDKTVTKQHVDGKSQLHAFGILANCPSVPPAVKKVVKEITQKYEPLDKDLSVAECERKKLMDEWWIKTIEAYKGLKISPEEIENTTREIGPPARENAKEFFDKLKKEHVPILLVSAGIGEFLEPLLKHMNINSDVEMLANYLKLDDEGKIVGYQQPPIHTTNKNDINFSETKFYQKVKNRHNVILMGDHLGDASMADNLENVENILKIGFSYKEAESVFPAWLNTFDIVLKDDQTMNVPLAILELLENKIKL